MTILLIHSISLLSLISQFETLSRLSNFTRQLFISMKCIKMNKNFEIINRIWKLQYVNVNIIKKYTKNICTNLKSKFILVYSFLQSISLLLHWKWTLTETPHLKFVFLKPILSLYKTEIGKRRGWKDIETSRNF